MKIAAIGIAAALAVLASGRVMADPRADLVAAMEALLARDGYRAHTTTTIARPEGPVVLAMTIDHVAPSRFRVVADGKELVILPDSAWLRKDGRWTPFEEDTSQLVAGFDRDAMRASLERIRAVRDLGNESISGCDASHFVYEAAIELAGQPVLVASDVWVCDRTGLPLRARSGDPGGTVTVTIDYDFAAELVIERPE